MINVKNFDLSKEDTRAFVEAYKTSLKNRNGDVSIVDNLVETNELRRKAVFESETLRAEQKRKSQDLGIAKKQGQDVSGLLEDLATMSKKVKELEVHSNELDAKLNGLALLLPNFTDPFIPVGKDEEANRVERTCGEKPNFSFTPKEHTDLGEALGIIDFDRAAKVSGARFSFLVGAGARLERALAQFMLDVQTTENGYKEIVPPYVVNSASMLGTGQFPKFVADAFSLAETDYHLIPTAEVPVTNYHRDEILSESDLPLRYCAFSPCFRSEAGSHGRDTKGLIRQHQFHKVEVVSFCHPDDSKQEHERLTKNAESILQKLGLHYRVVCLSTGDIGFGAYRCYDIEVWLPGQAAFREISSCSNFADFQARRANIRFRPTDGAGKPQFVHTLNGSALAVGRTLIAVLENYQQADGSILIPEVLRPYMGGATKIG